MTFHRNIRLFPTGVCLFLLLACQSGLANELPSPEEFLQGLLPDKKAEGIFKSWKGVKRNAEDKAETEDIPSFTIYVTFEFASEKLTNDGELLLSQAGLALIDKRMRKYNIFLAGHTDSVGSDSANMLLSQRRAETVRNYLIDNFKIDPEQLFARGYGESKLLFPNDPEADANRRVEIKNIGPKDQ